MTDNPSVPAPLSAEWWRPFAAALEEKAWWEDAHGEVVLLSDATDAIQEAADAERQARADQLMTDEEFNASLRPDDFRGKARVADPREEGLPYYVKRLQEALVEAALPLEVIAGQHRMKPYRELGPDLIQSVNVSIAAIRAALAATSTRSVGTTARSAGDDE